MGKKSSSLKTSNDPQDNDSMSSWCGWHTDHGSLNGNQQLMVRIKSINELLGLKSQATAVSL